MFLDASGTETPVARDEVPLNALVPLSWPYNQRRAWGAPPAGHGPAASQPRLLLPARSLAHPVPPGAWAALEALPSVMFRVQGLLAAAELRDAIHPPG